MSGEGFEKYAAGSKRYGGGRDAPNLGMVSKLGYRERDRKYQTQQKNNAILRRLKASQKGNTMNADWLSYPYGRMG